MINRYDCSRVPQFLLILLVLAFTVTIRGQQPNVIFILCDDLGYGDLGVFYQNSKSGTKKFVTPKLDQMATQGIQLRAHYTAAPVCAPARASLLLGVHQGHANVRDSQFDKALDDNHTLATVFKKAGYATAAVGKWGLQGSGSSPANWPAYPTKRGFDYFYGYVSHGAGHTQYPHHTTYDPNGSGTVVRTPHQVYDQNEMVSNDLAKCYSTDLFTARAKKWIVDHRSTRPNQPFFLYLAYSAPHAALQIPTVTYPTGAGLSGGLQWNGTPGEMINTAKGTIDSFIHPDYASKSWTNNEKRFATMVRRIDDCTGDLLKTLADLNIDENTLVVFTSDNGPHHESYFKATYEANSFNSYGPFDGTKRDCWEGGIREPALAWWPGTIPAGRISNRPSQFHDWMPTFAEVAGLPAPARSDGVSLLNDLTGNGTSPDSTVYIEYKEGGTTKNYSEFDDSHRGRRRNQMQVVFQNGLKGIRYDIQSHATPFEIYNVNVDPKETNNLASSRPEIQQSMKNQVLRLRRPDASAVRPYDNELIPSVNLPVLPGVEWDSYIASLPWVTDFSSLTPNASGITTSITSAVGTIDENLCIRFEGYIQVPTNGTYTFYLPSSGGSHLRIHETTVIDDDFARTGAVPSGTINLRAGLHPFRLYYRHLTGSPLLSLDWSGPGISRRALGGSDLRRFDADSSIPIARADQVATRKNTAISIPILQNDTDDGFPKMMSIAAIGSPHAGTASIQGSSIVYTPSNNFLGVDKFSYTITDGAKTSTTDVTVRVYFSDSEFWYPFNQTNGTTTFEAGGGSPATLKNFANPSASWVAGRFGYGLSFDNIDDFVSIDGFQGIQGSAARTCAAWIKTSASGSNDPIISWGPNSAGTKWTFMMNSSGLLRVEIGTGYVVGITTLNNGNWHHVACTFSNDGSPNAKDIKLYVNGVHETISSSASNTLNTSKAGDVKIGTDIQNRFWNGLIDEPLISSRAMSLSEIATLASSSPNHDPSAAAWWKRHAGSSAMNWSEDADGDGVSNLAEYAFGGNPNLVDSHTTNSVILREDETFRFEHSRLKAGTSSVIYQLRYSNDLLNWQDYPVSPTIILPSENSAYEKAIYQIPLNSDHEFFQVRAHSPQ